MTYVTNLIHYVRRVLRQPIGELNRAQWFLRNAIDLARHCARTLKRDRAGQMAAALTYRTIFSLVPIFLLAMIVFRAFGAFDQTGTRIEETVMTYLESVGISIEQLPNAADSDQPLIETIIRQLSDNVSTISFGSITVVGLVVLIWAALMLLITTEQCFNRIYNAPSGRPWLHRIPIYWALVTLGPVLILLSMYLGSQVVSFVGGVPTVGSLVRWTSGFGSFGATWLMLFLLFLLMPFTKVHARPAMVGSLVAAVLWEVLKWGFRLYVAKAVGYSALYGSLGLVPLFLLWLHSTWLIVLFGLEISYTLQTLKGYQLDEEQQRAQSQLAADPRWLIPLMAQIANAFARGKTVDDQQLAQTLHLPITVVVQLGRHLEKAGLLHHVDRGAEEAAGYSLAKPPDQIPITELIELGGSLHAASAANNSQPEWVMLERLTQAQRDAVRDQTLATMLDHA